MKPIARVYARSVLTLAAALSIPHLGLAQEVMDPRYAGSSFNEVLSVLEDQGLAPRTEKEAREIQVYQSGLLPQYPVNFQSLGVAAIALTSASKKTLAVRTDYYDRFEKLVHANGVCVAGEWRIDGDSPYSGYFRSGARALFIGRVSVALQETTRAGDRGFGVAGKVFPTLNPNERVATSNFFTVDVLSGTPSQRFLDVALTNNPPLVPSFSLAGVLSKIIPAFALADSQPTFRPVTHMARIGAGENVRSPVFIRLRPLDGTVKNDQADFRNEVLTAMQQNNGQLRFAIDVSETTEDRNATSGWSRVGTILLNRAMVSYGCDRRLHFAHPKDDKSNKGSN